jgi:hypothetical protein
MLGHVSLLVQSRERHEQTLNLLLREARSMSLGTGAGAVFERINDEHVPGSIQRTTDGRQLGHNVSQFTTVLNHRQHPSHLSLSPAQAANKLLIDFWFHVHSAKIPPGVSHCNLFLAGDGTYGTIVCVTPRAAATHVLLLDQETWTQLARAHHDRVDSWVGDRLTRRARGEKHPVDDFLFDYYPFSPARLRRWHPGAAARLQGRATEVLQTPGFIHSDHQTFFAAPHLPANVKRRLATDVPSIQRLIENVDSRPARFGCFGLHEWAMVLGLDADQVRHSSWPLRVTPDQIRQTIDDAGLRCTHFDAFRFFTSEAIPLNPKTLTRENQVDTDQAGCLHVGMDLYKYAMRLQPLVSMDLVADAFALARDARTLDMQGAPYDLSELAITPIALETVAGRAEFARRQRDHAQRSRVVRRQLIEVVSAWAQRVIKW